jgi:hypothetical protein
MQYDAPHYYRPYNDQDDDLAGRSRSNSSTTDSSTVSDISINSSGGTDTGDTLDPRYELIRAAGPRLTEDKQYDVSVPKKLWETRYPFQSPPPFPTESQSLLQQNPPTKQQLSQFSFNSQNRDTSQYPFSSYMKIMLPRVYKNVSSFNVVQIAFPNLNGVIPNNTAAIESEIERALIKTIFNIDNLVPNSNPNLCEPQQVINTDIINEITQFRYNPTSLIKPYDYCLSYQLAGSFLGVSSCLDTILISEDGRSNPAGGPLYLAYNIPQGRYIPSSIVTALNNSMNSSPYFSLYDFNDYTALIQGGKGAIIGFAYPNLTYYNNLVKQYITEGLTRETIAKFYYPNIETIFSKPPTVNEIFVSYYYPSLKEALISPILRYLINYLDYDIIQVYNDSVLKFLGLNYKMYLDICTANETFLSTIRDYYTQKYYAVNIYNWYFNTDRNRIGVTFNAINNCITTTVRNEFAENFQASLIFNDITQEDYDDAINTLNSGTSGLPVIQSMAAFFSQQLGLNLGVTLIDYSLDDISNNYTLYNTENIVALLPGYQLSQPPAGYVNNFSSSQFSGIWPGMMNLSEQTWEFFKDQKVPYSFTFETTLNTNTGPQLYSYNTTGQYVFFVYEFIGAFQIISPPIDVSMNHSYNIDTNSFLTVDSLNNNTPILAIDGSNNQIQNVNNIFNDITVHIPAGKYVVVPFSVSTTQNVQLMTLPRPYLYRYPNYNTQKDFSLFNGAQAIPTLNTFPGISFMFNYNYTNFATDSKYLVIDSPNIINLQNINFTNSLQEALSLSVFSPSYTLNFMTPQQFFQIIPPQPNISGQNFVGQRYNTNLSIIPVNSTVFNADMDILIYLDFAQYCADMANTYSNDPYFWKYKISIKKGDTSGSINFPVYSNYATFDSSGNFFINQLPYPLENIEGNYDILTFVQPDAPADLNNEAYIIYNSIFFNQRPYKPFWIRVHYPNSISEPQSFKLALWGQTNRIDVIADFINPSGPNIPSNLDVDFNQYTWDQVLTSGIYNGQMSYYYASALDPDFAGANPINGSSPSSYSFNKLVSMTEPFIGRDKNGISTDLTDYRAFSINPANDLSGNNRTSEFRGDPVTGYYFKVLSSYNNEKHSYFYNGSQNAVYKPNNQIYSFTSTDGLDREFKLTHWLHQYYFPPQYNTNWFIIDGTNNFESKPYNYLNVIGLGPLIPKLQGLVNSNLKIIPNIEPTCPAGLTYGNIYPNLTISDYYNYLPFSDYIGMYNNSPGSRFPAPIIGFTFNLPDGVYNLKRLTFKSAYIGPDVDDPNNYNSRLYVFNAADITIKKYDDLLNNPLAILRPATSVPWRSTFDSSGNRQFSYPSTYSIDSSSNLQIIPELIQNISNTGTMIDNQYGTYYTYEIDTEYVSTQFRGTSLPTGSIQTNNYGNYCFCVVSDFQDICESLFYFGNLWLLAGSMIPNPDYSEIDPINNSFQPSARPPVINPTPPYNYKPWPSSDGNIYNPLTGNPENNAYLIPTQTLTPTYPSQSVLESQYEQSMPINTVGIINGAAPLQTSIIDEFNIVNLGNMTPTFSIQYNYFWPVQNIVFTRVGTTYKPMIELNNIINPLTNQDASGQFEVGRTQMFIYDNIESFYADTKSIVPIYDDSGNPIVIDSIPQTQTVYNWGSESHYINADTNFNGYYSNSYIPNFVAEKDKIYYLVLRAFSPAEDFQCLVRFQASQQTQINVANTSPSSVLVTKTSKELYTFGLKTTDMISDEYFLYNLAKLTTSITPDYATSLVNFYEAFNGNFVFGLNNFIFKGFEDVLIDQSANEFFIPEFRSLWSALQPAYTLLNDVDNYALYQTNTFIDKYYEGILPDSLLDYNTLAGNTNLSVIFYGKNLAVQSSNPFQVPAPNCSGYKNVVGNILARISNQFSCFPAGATVPTVEVQVGFPFDTITGTASVEGQNNNIINQNFYIQFNPDLPQINQLDVALTERPISQNLNQICPGSVQSNTSGLTAKQYTQNLINTTLQATNYVSREFVGSSQIVFGKIIANNSVDNVTQTLLAGQVNFDPPIGKLDHLTITIFTQDLYPVYQVYPYITPELEWNSIISITENVSQVPADNITQVARIDVSGEALPF